MHDAGIEVSAIEAVAWSNPVSFFSQGGRLDVADLDNPPPVDQRELWKGNSVLRGQEPTVRRTD
jgi:hypothetical protein